MKKYISILIVFVIIALAGCRNEKEDVKQTTEWFKATVIEVNNTGVLAQPVETASERSSGDRVDVPNKDGIELQVGDIIAIEYDGSILETYPLQLGEVYSITLVERAKPDSSGEEKDNLSAKQKEVPSKEEVLAIRAEVLSGMSKEEIERLKENIKVANQQMENAYLNDNIFEKLKDVTSLYWNYFDEKGDIQTGFGPDGTPVMEYNRFDAENFIDLMEDMKKSVKNKKLQADMQKIIDETALAAETHDAEHAYNIFQLLHDMDYYLLRYGPEDVGKYVQDTSMISKYYGVLSVYSSED